MKHFNPAFISDRHRALRSKNSDGFTIVELLIVIIVIGILAAIIIVAYNGVTSQAKDSAAKAAATTVKKKIEAYNAVKGDYPTTFATADLDGLDESAISSAGVTLGTFDAGADQVTAANGQSKVILEICDSGGSAYRITYYDYRNGLLPADGLGSTVKGGGSCGHWTVAT